MKRRVAAVAALALVLAGCGEDNDGAGAQPAGSTTTPSTTATPASGGALPGERAEIHPYQGARLAVVGVAAADKLKVRSGPGVEFGVVFELGPLASDAVATGHNRSVENGGFWSEITVDDRTGWANAAFLLQPGQVTDVTAALFPTPSARPKAQTMDELAQTVARRRAGAAEPPAKIVVVDGPTVGDLGEITVDVIGLGDDAQGGERLKIFAEPGPPGARFTARTVEATALCSRGVTKDGLCV
jgi:hypothetical protein